MSLSKFKADKKLVDIISASVRAGRVFHAYIIEGDSVTDKLGFAKEFCKAVLCHEEPGQGCGECSTCRKIEHGNHEDLHIIEADGMSVKDEQIENLQYDIKKKPLGDRNIVIINNADTMTARAQNRLLKTLEEPFDGAVIILLSENRLNLLDTIRSRCIVYRLENGVCKSEVYEKAEFFFDMIYEKKGFVKVKQEINSRVKSRDEAFELIDGLERIYQKLLKWEDVRRKNFTKEDIFFSIKAIEEARRDLIAKVNYQYAVKNLFLKIGI